MAFGRLGLLGSGFGRLGTLAWRYGYLTLGADALTLAGKPLKQKA